MDFPGFCMMTLYIFHYFLPFLVEHIYSQLLLQLVVY